MLKLAKAVPFGVSMVDRERMAHAMGLRLNGV